MQVKIKPIFILNKGENAFRHLDGTREIISDEAAVNLRAAQLSKELRDGLQYRDALLDEAIVRDEQDLAKLKMEALRADGLLLYLIGYMPLQTIFNWGVPVIAFSGQYTPMVSLYALGVERQSRPDITIALDFQDIDEELQLLDARKKLQNSRIALFGFPPYLFSRWHHLPDFELARQKLGVQFSAVELRELVAQLPTIDQREAQAVAERWRQEAKEVIEPSMADVVETARIYLALHQMLDREKANALALNCLEMMRSLQVLPPCYALTRLRDEGVHAACEADVIALLTMMLLGYLADVPAFMGNIVAALPNDNILRISHDVVPTKMAGFSQPPRNHILRNYHWSPGVTAHVELDIGQEVTIARLARNLDKILILRGELVDCQDTIACRTTISAKVSDVRKFMRSVFGNHHVLVYGNHVKQAKTLCHRVGIDSIEL